VVSFDDGTVEVALEGLRAQGLAVRISGESRVPKHAQRFTEKFNLGRREAAIMCVLMLRGPQTPGELRGRTERLFQFDDLEAVEHTLQHLTEMEWVRKLPRQAGSRESRFAHLLSGDVDFDAEEAVASPHSATPGALDRIALLEAQLAQLRREFDEFRKGFE
jgi:uncharacterized protein YceH (UPF0502 family)